GNVVASQGIGWRLQVEDLADRFRVANHDRCLHSPFAPALVPRAGTIEIATTPVLVRSVHDPRTTPRGLELRCRLADADPQPLYPSSARGSVTTRASSTRSNCKKVKAALSRPPLERCGPSRSTRSSRLRRNSRRR